jgi:4-hydroxy-tetrahydrodipicolinate synthase
VLKGVYTAIVTPFCRDESIDEQALRTLIDSNIEGGVTGIVACGTTGESPTLSHGEHRHVVELVVEHVDGRVPVIAGTGSNSTQEAIALTGHAAEAGVDGVLLVNPYYNKPTQEGLYRHFRAIAEDVDVPCIIYNHFGRTRINVETDTLMRLANDCTNIVGVKEASGDMEQIRDVIAQRPEGFSVLSGDDAITLDLIRAGGDGVIAVTSNLLPERMAALVQAALDGDFEQAEAIHQELTPVFEATAVETNPIPIKYALSLVGMCEEVYRLPMCEPRPASKALVRETMQHMQLL